MNAPAKISTLNIGLACVERGWSIFPVEPGAKAPPLVKDDLRVASSDAAQIRAWHKKFHGANWAPGLAKSRLLVIDVDLAPGKNGRASLDRLELEYGKLPKTFTVKTPRGGHHLYFRGEHVFRLGFREGLDSPHYVIAPGCALASGGEYTIITDAPIVDAPAWLYEVIGEHVEREHVEQTAVVELDQESNIAWAIHYLKQDAPPSIEGRGGEKVLLDVAGVLKDHAISEPKAVELLDKHYNVFGRCDPLWSIGDGPDADRLDVKVNNAYTYLISTAPGAATAEAQFAGDPVPDDELERLRDVDAENEAARLEKLEIEKPTVTYRPADLPRVVRKVQDNLIVDSKKLDALASDQIFQRGGELVHLNRNRLKPRKPGAAVDQQYHVEDDLLVRSAAVEWLTDRAMRAMRFMSTTRRKQADGTEKTVKTPCAAPAIVIRTLGKISTSWNFPKLIATTETPTLRPDGSILEAFGYDERSGLYLDTAGVEFPPIKVRPTMADARTALAILKRPLVDFPFCDEDGVHGLSQSVQLAAMMTAVVRRSLPTAPAFGFDANEVESGKTELAQVNAIMATGRRTGERPFTGDADEQRKMLSAAFAAGDSVILFDNVDEDIEGGPLCGALTERLMTTRRLGGNRAEDDVKAPTCSLIEFTGNHLTVKADMTARVLLSKLVPDKNLAERKFTYAPLDAYLIKHRPLMVAAALTIMRAYIVAGRPTPGPTSRFPEWRAMVADALIWLGEPDPCLSFERARAADPVREAFAAVLRSWVGDIDPTEWRTTADIRRIPGVEEAIADPRLCIWHRLLRSVDDGLVERPGRRLDGSGVV